MILGPLVAASLIIGISAQPGIDPTQGAPASTMSTQKKDTILRPLVRAATECVVRAVAADPRLATTPESADIRDLIVATMPTCADAMRAMIDVHDQLYGDGSGEQFFMGPYLDTLPATVMKSVKEGAVR